MKVNLFFGAAIFTFYSLTGNIIHQAKNTSQTLAFTENKGQVSDQFHKSRLDVLFSGSDGKLAYHLRKKGFSYQMTRVDVWQQEKDQVTKIERKIPKETTIYRVDFDWVNMKHEAKVVRGEAGLAYRNYYLEQCPNGVLNVLTYNEVTYKQVYPGIDLTWYEKDGHLKYDYLVSAGADYRQICLEIKGAENIFVSKTGELVIKTPLGEILEQAPLVKQGGRILNAKWIVEHNTVKFEIDDINPLQAFVIDPVVCVRTWGTYYGGAQQDDISSCAINSAGDIFTCGNTLSSVGTQIATVGSHQSTFGGGIDAVLARFNASGSLVWATYYGGTGSEEGTGCAVNSLGDVFMVGTATSPGSTLVASAGAHQTTFNGVYDAFLVKFNLSGVRQWGTYYGGSSEDRGTACATNSLGEVYITGYSSTNSGTFISSPGAHQTSKAGSTLYDAFLAKFNSSGVRQWGTYYGDTSTDYGYSCAVSSSGDVYMTGSTMLSAGTTIATASSHQPLIGANSQDAFLVKFNANGLRQWGTYYGGTNDDIALSCVTNSIGDIYIAGSTNSSGGTVIATTASHQSTLVAALDGFLAKFNSSGVRQWGTYYGGAGDEFIRSVAIGPAGDVYVAGDINIFGTNTVMATYGSYQTSHAGGTYDAFLAKFSSVGARQWATYYGGENSDFGYACATNTLGEVFLAGTSASTITMASAGSYQGVNAGGDDGYLVKFSECTTPAPPTNVTSSTNQTICAANTSILQSIGSGTVSWYSSSTSTAALATGTAYTTPVLGAGSYTYYAENFLGCISATRTAISVTVNPQPTVTVNNGSVCAGSSFTIIPGGAGAGATYTTSAGTTIVSPSTNTFYSVVGTSSLGCASSNTAVSNVTVNAVPTISASSGSICSGKFFTITPSGASSYTYSSGTANVNPTTTTSYSITGKSVQGCLASNIAIVTVTVNTTPTISANSGSVCLGNTFVIAPSGGGTYTITGGSFTVSPITNSSYSVTGTSTAGCAASNTVVSSVVVNSLPTISVNNGTICPGSSFVITPAGASTYTFSGGSATVSPAVNTSYSVTGTSSLGCISTNTAISAVAVYSLPLFAVNSGTICSGNSFTLTPSGGTSYTFASGSAVVSPQTNTSYVVTGADAQGCTNTVISTIVVNASPTISVNSSTLCAGNSYTLNPSGAFSYTYSGGSNVVSPTSNALYFITGISALGCAGINTAIATITVYAAPVVSVNSGSICSGNTFTIIPSGASNYSLNGSGSNFTVSPVTNTSYSLTGISAQGCASSNTAVTTITVSPSPTVTVNSGTMCSGTSFTLIPAGAQTYSISGGSAIVSPTTNTLYYVTGVNASGCAGTNTAIATITVYAAPVVSVNSGSICSGNTFTIIPSGASNYSLNGSGSNFTVSPFTNTSYSLTGISTQGCASSNTAVTTITVTPSPTVTINSGTMCLGTSFTLIPAGAQTYSISGGSAIVSPTTNMLYYVTGVNANGCAGINTAVATVSVFAAPVISANNGTICIGQQFTIVPSGGTSYTYSEGSAIVSPTTTSSYTVTSASPEGCIGKTLSTVVADLCTGIRETNTSEHISVYPNPTTNNFTINTESETDVVITNALGQIVLQTHILNGKNIIEFTNKAPGIYFIKAKTGVYKIVRD